jgi:hypothetical protein
MQRVGQAGLIGDEGQRTAARGGQVAVEFRSAELEQGFGLDALAAIRDVDR